MPDTRPGLTFNDEGVCQACLNFDRRQKTDWQQRWQLLSKLCAQYRGDGTTYDCLIAVSGGKDSHFLVHTLKEFGMHPLLFNVTDPFTTTKAGAHNLPNLSNHFGCDLQQFTLNVDLHRKLIRHDFETELNPLKVIEMLIYILPTFHAAMLDIPLVFFGEDSGYLYGGSKEDTPDALPSIRAMYDVLRTDFWGKNPTREAGKELRLCMYPATFGHVQVHYMSYYVPWDDEENYKVAKQHGFRDLEGEWRREGWLENYTQIDSYGYLVHIWCKYPKFGFQRVTDMASRWIRKKKGNWRKAIYDLTQPWNRKEAMGIDVPPKDHKLDPLALKDFCNFCGYSERRFWSIVDRFYNKDIFEETPGGWRLKEEGLWPK